MYKDYESFFSFPNASTAYGATLIEHSLIEAGLSGSIKIDSQVDSAQGIVGQLETILFLLYFSTNLQLNLVSLLFSSVAPKILEALQIAETYMEKTENFSGKVSSF